MKRGGFLKRKTPLQTYKGLKSSTPLKSYSRLAKQSKDDVPACKDRIQKLLRTLTIKRDNSCIMRHYPETGACGGRKGDGSLVLQADHIVTRANSATYGDMRNIVCLCQRHHGFWKPQHPTEYTLIVFEYVTKAFGVKHALWLSKAIEESRRQTAHRMTLWDWQKVELSLTQDLSRSSPRIQTKSPRKKP